MTLTEAAYLAVEAAHLEVVMAMCSESGVTELETSSRPTPTTRIRRTSTA